MHQIALSKEQPSHAWVDQKIVCGLLERTLNKNEVVFSFLAELTASFHTWSFSYSKTAYRWHRILSGCFSYFRNLSRIINQGYLRPWIIFIQSRVCLSCFTRNLTMPQWGYELLFFSQVSVEGCSLSSPPPPATPPPPPGIPYNVAAGLGTKGTKGAVVQTT